MRLASPCKFPGAGHDHEALEWHACQRYGNVSTNFTFGGGQLQCAFWTREWAAVSRRTRRCGHAPMRVARGIGWQCRRCEQQPSCSPHSSFAAGAAYRALSRPRQPPK